jgi:hypothetical protein
LSGPRVLGQHAGHARRGAAATRDGAPLRYSRTAPGAFH